MVGEIEGGGGGGSERVTEHEEKALAPRPLGSQVATLALGLLVLAVPLLWILGHLGAAEEQVGVVGVWGVWVVAFGLLVYLLVRMART